MICILNHVLVFVNLFNFEYLRDTRPDFASPTTLLGSLTESQREMSEKLELINRDNEYMNYLELILLLRC